MTRMRHSYFLRQPHSNNVSKHFYCTLSNKQRSELTVEDNKSEILQHPVSTGTDKMFAEHTHFLLVF